MYIYFFTNTFERITQVNRAQIYFLIFKEFLVKLLTNYGVRIEPLSMNVGKTTLNPILVVERSYAEK